MRIAVTKLWHYNSSVQMIAPMGSGKILIGNRTINTVTDEIVDASVLRSSLTCILTHTHAVALPALMHDAQHTSFTASIQMCVRTHVSLAPGESCSEWILLSSTHLVAIGTDGGLCIIEIPSKTTRRLNCGAHTFVDGLRAEMHLIACMSRVFGVSILLTHLSAPTRPQHALFLCRPE